MRCYTAIVVVFLLFIKFIIDRSHNIYSVCSAITYYLQLVYIFICSGQDNISLKSKILELIKQVHRSMKHTQAERIRKDFTLHFSRQYSSSLKAKQDFDYIAATWLTFSNRRFQLLKSSIGRLRYTCGIYCTAHTASYSFNLNSSWTLLDMRN